MFIKYMKTYIYSYFSVLLELLITDKHCWIRNLSNTNKHQRWASQHFFLVHNRNSVT